MKPRELLRNLNSNKRVLLSWIHRFNCIILTNVDKMYISGKGKRSLAIDRYLLTVKCLEMYARKTICYVPCGVEKRKRKRSDSVL